jgi:hypothetical protein
VISETSLQTLSQKNSSIIKNEKTNWMGIPASLIFFAVPPDPNNRTPDSWRPLARSRRLVLSYTDKRAANEIIYSYVPRVLYVKRTNVLRHSGLSGEENLYEIDQHRLINN